MKKLLTLLPAAESFEIRTKTDFADGCGVRFLLWIEGGGQLLYKNDTDVYTIFV